MVAIPPIDSTLVRIYKGYEERNRMSARRLHLGASEIGKECERQIWYNFRWTLDNEFEGRILRLFETGKLEENRLVNDLASVGVEFQAFNMKTGRQWGVKAFGGHFSGSLDGLCLGIIEAPKTWHVAEFKTHSEKSFAKLKKEGVKSAKPEHWHQMNVYMGLSHEQTEFPATERAVYMAVNKNTDELYLERVHFDVAEFLKTKEKAARIIFTDIPPPRISSKPDFYLCRFCNFNTICHAGRDAPVAATQIPKKSCRTCLHSTPRDDGTWTCARWENKKLAPNEQAAGCEKHLYIPALLPWKQISVNEQDGVVYENAAGDEITNNEGGTFDFKAKETA